MGGWGKRRDEDTKEMMAEKGQEKAFVYFGPGWDWPLNSTWYYIEGDITCTISLRLCSQQKTFKECLRDAREYISVTFIDLTYDTILQ